MRLLLHLKTVSHIATACLRWWLLCLLPMGVWAQQPTVNGTTVRVGVYDNPPKIFMGTDGLPDGIFGQMTREAGACGWLADQTRAVRMAGLFAGRAAW
jgi:hypothetical protein